MQKPASEHILIRNLVLDEQFYPREGVKEDHWRRMLASLEAGHKLPSIVVENETLRVVDGWHRVRAYRAYVGEEYMIECLLRSYPSERHLFAEAIARNAIHGHALQRADYAVCVSRGKKIGLGLDEVARMLRITRERLDEVPLQPEEDLKSLLISRTGGESHSAIRRARVQSREGPGGVHHEHPLLYHVNRLTVQLEKDTTRWGKDVVVVQRLRELRGLLNTLLSE